MNGKPLIFLLLTAITATAQIPIANTNDSIECWQIMFWQTAITDSVTEVVDGDTVSLEWVQPCYRSDYDFIENVPPDSQKVDSLVVYTYDINLSMVVDTATIENIYAIELFPGDYCFSVKALTTGGEETIYGDPFLFRVVDKHPLMYPVRIKLIIK